MKRRFQRLLCWLNYHHWSEWRYTGTVRIPREEGEACGVRVTVLGCEFDYHRRTCQWCQEDELTSVVERDPNITERLLPVEVLHFTSSM